MALSVQPLVADSQREETGCCSVLELLSIALSVQQSVVDSLCK